MSEPLLDWKRCFNDNYQAQRGWLTVYLHREGRKWWGEVEGGPVPLESDLFKKQDDAAAWAEEQVRHYRDVLLPAEMKAWEDQEPTDDITP